MLGDTGAKTYLHEYATVPDVRRGIQDYFQEYNTEHPHEALEYATPAEVYFDSFYEPSF